MRSLESMAREMLMRYTMPLVLNGKEIHPGWPPEIAARKAAAANPNFAREIHKIAKALNNENN
jgi:hypothetical protein